MKNKSLALDTNAAIAIINENAKAIRQFRRFGQWILPVVVYAELRFGALKSAAVEYNLSRLDELQDACSMMQIDDKVAAIQADRRLQLMKAGQPIGDNDLWIAASCLANRIPLATKDAHFQRLPQLATIEW